jgi:phage terminase small subunit
MSAFKLTAKQERFVLLIVKGETQSTAYEKAGYGVKSTKVAATNACNLLKKPNIQGRIAELQASLAQKTVITLESLTEELRDIKAKALAAGSFGPAVAAVVAVAKLNGFMVDKTELTVNHRPAPLPTKIIELSEDEWIEQFGTAAQRQLQAAARLINKK